MSLPKGFVKKIKLLQGKSPVERRQELLDEVTDKGAFLPRGVAYEDMDAAFIEYVKNDLQIEIDGQRVPVVFLTIQRWSEFAKTWEFTDDMKEIKLPFIAITRKPDVQVGTNHIGLWNIPGHKTYTHVRVPTFEGGRRGVDLYKIPQPTCVDISYEIRFFCNRMGDTNILNTKIQLAYQARQSYIQVNGHFMPTVLETVSDESPMDDFESKRFYLQSFDILLQGYILNEDDYIVVPTLNRAIITTELDEQNVMPKYRTRKDGDLTVYEFIFKCSEISDISFAATQNIRFTNVIEKRNVSSMDILINGDSVTFPFDIQSGDNVHIVIGRNTDKESRFKLIGNVG